MVKVIDVIKGSPAFRAGIRSGDGIISVNGRVALDMLDIIYADSEDTLDIELLDRKLIINKYEYEPLGITTDDIRPLKCRNKCIFCFIDQLPRGMRKSLYVKDDDYRLSLISGNYISLTNLTRQDIDRITAYKISPLYVSVHAFDSDVRVKLTGNPASGKMFDVITELIGHGIKLHTQIVLVKGVNDGDILINTLNELLKLYPGVSSVAVVPVGLTKFREGLYPIEPIGKKDAQAAIEITESVNNSAKEIAERGFSWCSDEMYIRAGKDLPDLDYYGDFLQIENGVGMVRAFESTISYDFIPKKEKFHLVTGESFYPFLKRTVDRINTECGAELTAHKVVNNYFGNTVTVAGLLTGQDIIAQLKGITGHLLIPSDMLNMSKRVFLDGISVKELEDALNVRVTVAGDNLIDIIGEQND